MELKRVVMAIFLVVQVFWGFPGWAKPGVGDEARSGETQWQWQVDDLVTLDEVSSYSLSLDGKQLAWTVSCWDLKEQKKYDIIYLTGLQGKPGKDNTKNTHKIQLTRGLDKYSALQWVPGENKISFLTNRKFKDTEPNNLWVIDLDGGEPYPVTSLEQGITQYEWLDKENILLVTREGKTLLENETKEKKDTTVVVEDEDHQIIFRLFSFNIKTRKMERLTSNIKPIQGFWLSRDKKWVIYAVNMSIRYEVDQEIRPKFYLMNLSTPAHAEKEILSDPQLKPEGNFIWAWDNSGFYTTMSLTTHPKYNFAAETVIYWYSLKDGAYSPVNLDWEQYAMSAVAVPQGLLVSLYNGARLKFALYSKIGDKWNRTWLMGDALKNVFRIQVAADGKTVIYSHSTASQPWRFYWAELKNDRLLHPIEVMDIDSPLFKKPLTKTEVIQWKGAMDDTIEGILYYPYHYIEGKKYPLILLIHGGPHAADMDYYDDNWAYPAHLLAERGAFLLKVNYHGSAAYGLKFSESIVGHYYEYEIPDIEKGVNYLVSQGKVDENQLGIIGWSNGAILGCMLTVQSHRYQAASLGAGDVNWISDYGNCAFGVVFDNLYLGGAPWEKLDTYIKKSPLFQLHQVTTPTLIFHGTEDRAVPYEQGWEYYRALQVSGKAPVRFITFPGEGHSPQILAHRRRKVDEEVKWFDKYLFKTYKEKNESLKKNSPLEQLEITRKIPSWQGYYGIDKKGLLCPEWIKYKKMEISRFEVTRAQWACFDKSYQVEPGTGNYPITGITFAQAQEYTAWLSTQCGEKFRLPRENEIEILYDSRSGNTFDYWAGYTVNPDDYRNLVSELTKFKDEPVLLKPVGVFTPMGDEPVFDLDGNAAEWVEIEVGKGKACGGSADCPLDKSSLIEPRPQYIGLRVVREVKAEEVKGKSQ